MCNTRQMIRNQFHLECQISMVKLITFDTTPNFKLKLQQILSLMSFSHHDFIDGRFFRIAV